MKFQPHALNLNTVLFLIFAIIICAHLPYTVQQADAADASQQGQIYTISDDPTYQIPAINMLHGLGYWLSMNLPLEDYHMKLMGVWAVPLQQQMKKAVDYAFFRAPGFPWMLTAVYALFGDQPITARHMFAVLNVVTALLLLSIGAYSAGWVGSLAGGLVGLYTIHFEPDLTDYVHIMTEIPTAFWLALFMLFFVIYLRRRYWLFLVLSALSFVALLFVRSVFAFGLPVFILYLLLAGHNIKRVAAFIVIVLLPVSAWSAYVSHITHSFVPMTVQGGAVFPQYNNIDVLEGNFIEAGVWNPGEYLQPDGTIAYDSHNNTYPPDNPWVKVLIFWKDHVTQLPQLFYEKLNAAFWYGAGMSDNQFQMERLELFGIGALLASLGFRPSRRKTPLLRFSARTALFIQLGLLSVLLVASNRAALWINLLIWAAILLIAVLRPYGEVYRHKSAELTAYLGIVGYQFIISVLFGGDGGNRFQHPLDPLLLLCATVGILAIALELTRGLYKAIRSRLYLPWNVILPFAVVNLAVVAAIVVFPNLPTEQWMLANIPPQARVVSDYASYSDVFPATYSKSSWNWKMSTVSLALNSPDIDPAQDTYLYIDERERYAASFKTRLDTLIARGAILLYQSENPLDIGLRQAILVQPKGQMIIRATSPVNPVGG